MLGTSELSIPNDISYLPAIHAYAERVADQCGFGERDKTMILLAIEEAVTSVIEHAFECGEKAAFTILFECASTCLSIAIRDKGLPYEPNLVPEFSVGSAVEQGLTSGLGALLMRKSVDEVSFSNLGRDGKEVRLTKYLPFKSITGYLDTGELEVFSQQPQSTLPPARAINTELRLMRPHEAIEVSRLFYRCYGYSYFMDAIYYPDRLAQLVREGKIICAVMVTENNEIVGTASLVRPETSIKIAEAGMAATKPSFRGSGIMTKLVDFLLEEARKMMLEGLFGEGVTFHTYSQKVSHACGLRDCAIALGIIPSDVVFKGISDKFLQRGSLLYLFLPLVQLSKVTLYVPPHHASFIEKIYRHMELRAQFSIEENEEPRVDEGQPVFKTQILTADNRAEITIVRYGVGTLQETARIMKDLLRKKVDQISLYLDLEDRMTATLCQEFEKLGFFISGVLPLLHFKHCLILQYLNDISLDYSLIQLHSEFAASMLDYIHERDPNT